MLCFLALFSTSLGVPEDTPNSTYRTTTAEVQLTFSATDSRGDPVVTLGPQDFAIVDRGDIIRNFQSFARADFTRIDLTVLVDSSESAVPDFKREIADTLELVSQTGGIPEEQSSIISFHGVRPSLICSSDCRASLAASRVSSLPANGLTPLFDAVLFAAELTPPLADPHVRKVFVLLSDGEDTVSQHSAADALAAALARNVQIYAMDTHSSTHSSQGTMLLQKLASATGGRYFTVRQGLNKLYESVLEDLHTTYSVTYKLPGHAAGFHSVRILPTHNLNLRFHCRSGYNYSSRGH
jgi:Ca-activated chloride channel homolog